MNNHIEILASNLARAHAQAIHDDLRVLAAHPDESADQLTEEIASAIEKHAERLGVCLCTHEQLLTSC
ncbi:hypothetical protein P0D88_30675 [Paraburkholderia sp. RL18-103-BIB-C]|jgi:hypothetical protein|uniref:hypothetical protein n=1 Tax=unclassified Paraburkholderia TaxID=2615204 RepID=UPI0038BA2304